MEAAGPKGVHTEGAPDSAGRDLPLRLRLGMIPAAFVFFFWMAFSAYGITFYRDDNVIHYAPLVIDAARQIKSGRIPWDTSYMGGGGGTPLITIMQPGVLNPLVLIPALFLGNYPETMVNVAASLHLAVFALGGWYLAAALRAPLWASLVASVSLGFCGSFAVGVGNWFGLYLPYTFLPWLLGALVKLAETPTSRSVLGPSAVAAWAAVSMFFSGVPTVGLYGGLVVLCGLPLITADARDGWRGFFLRLIPVATLFVILVGPLLIEAKHVHDYYARRPIALSWINLSVPPAAYLGMLIPLSESTWQHIGLVADFTNFPMFCGAVPVWFILGMLIVRPRLAAQPGIASLLVGLFLFVLVLSPAAFGLPGFFARTPVLNYFREPFRALTAFHVLVVFLFLAVATRSEGIGKRSLGALLVGICLAASLLALVREVNLAEPGFRIISWFATNRYFEDPEAWDERTLARLRSAGYVMNLCRMEPRGVWFEKPRLYFTGALGAQFRVRTLHRYVFAGQAEPYRLLGMQSTGLTSNWPAVKDFLDASALSPPSGRVTWKNGIGPMDVPELAAKTYVGAIIVDPAFAEPIEYFKHSSGWELLSTLKSALLFVRKQPHN